MKTYRRWVARPEWDYHKTQKPSVEKRKIRKQLKFKIKEQVIHQ